MSEIIKVWGKELIYHNNDKYCFKRLLLNQYYQCSTHYHKIKEETFYLESGKIILSIDNIDISFEVGDFITIHPYTYHHFYGIEKSVIIECSTQDFTSDSYRNNNELSRYIDIKERLKK
jgi:mannose-6-phosphate isomerase-like protein (cupin superfamily)